jgi:hypothetical protein
VTAYVVTVDDSTRTMLTLLRNHLAKEPDRDAFPYDDGRAQAAYWAAYDEWQAVGFGLRMMVGARLISVHLAAYR